MARNQLKPRILSALLSTKTIKEAAEVAGTTERTVYKYLHDPEFLADLTAYNSACLKYAAGLTARSMEDAIGVLRTVMHDKESTPQTRVSAARSLLEFGLRVHDAVDLLSRVEALEKETGDWSWH